MSQVLALRRRSRMLALLAGVLFLGFLIEQSPHLVHHLFEPERASPECVFAVGAERAPLASTAEPALPVPDRLGTIGPLPQACGCPAGVRAPADSRAPPPVAL